MGIIQPILANDYKYLKIFNAQPRMSKVHAYSYNIKNPLASIWEPTIPIICQVTNPKLTLKNCYSCNFYNANRSLHLSSITFLIMKRFICFFTTNDAIFPSISKRSYWLVTCWASPLPTH
jgi:hypothetical protein